MPVKLTTGLSYKPGHLMTCCWHAHRRAHCCLPALRLISIAVRHLLSGPPLLYPWVCFPPVLYTLLRPGQHHGAGGRRAVSMHEAERLAAGRRCACAHLSRAPAPRLQNFRHLPCGQRAQSCRTRLPGLNSSSSSATKLAPSLPHHRPPVSLTFSIRWCTTMTVRDLQKACQSTNHGIEKCLSVFAGSLP